MGLKTLLIELDSSGEITRHFGVEQDRSMPTLADNQSDPTTSIWAIDSPDLHLLQFNTVGRSLYGNELEAVGRTMNSVKSIYEVIIVDAPALAKEPYALRVAEWLDHVLVISLADISRIELLKYKLRAMRL